MRIELPDATPAELALPGGTPTRGLVLFPDIGGLRPLFDELCARLAGEHGWAVCAVEPFPGRTDLPVGERLEAMSSYDTDAYLRSAGLAAEHLQSLGADPVAALGFCMGGMAAYLAAGVGRYDRVVSFYGMIHVPESWAGTVPDPLAATTAPGASQVLAIVGTADGFTPPADVADLEATGARVVKYEGAEHGFVHDPSRPVHRGDDAADAWARVAAFLGA
ncbi:MAG TPA: dienelactone hydrolase family protein [Acidimicrobiales bacterium]|jgi:carboxymethylenebutenolidase|nr:dienelactone hydrolase family protein [Acidimicrobiales bacterium]